ncbi:MAG: sulfoxide reductase heme-binding subunit YedZ [Acidobacteria bacterium]|nr:MAG: sulfoxide reductase heme-binding subunit YedZ [Acidobacteriota bacterium]
MPKLNPRWILKPAVFLICLVPMVWLAWDTVSGNLTANWLEDFRDRTGIWTLRFLMITLSVTPLRRITGWHSLIRFRRMLGLFTFFHSFLHFITYIWLDQFFAFDEILKDITKRPFIISGFAGFFLLIPLAITSTKKWIGRLGGKRWQMLHRFIYVSAVAGVLHYYWRVKLDVRDPVAYGVLLAVLLGFRAFSRLNLFKPLVARVGSEKSA